MASDSTPRGGGAADSAADLRQRGLRVTPQRRAILAAFMGGGDEHLSADEIHLRALAGVPGLGRGTVYTTLADLAEVGLLASVGDQDPVRYETNTEAHDHFRCRLCLRLFDVALADAPTSSLVADGYQIEDVSVLAEGICRECRHYSAGLRAGIQTVHDTPQVGADVLSAIACVRHETKIGAVAVGASADGVTRVVLEGLADFGAFAERARSRRGGREAREHAGRAMRSVEALLAGDDAQASDVCDWARVGDGNRAVLESTRAIAWGERRSYHRLLQSGPPAYRCGVAMGSNPMPFILPCHRVSCGREVSSDYVAGRSARAHLERLEHPPH